MVIRTFKIAIVLCLAAVITPLYAYCEPRFYTEVHPNYGTVEDAFIFSIVLENVDSPISTPLLTGGNDFNLSLMGHETGVSFINGAVSRQVTFNYQLIPKQAGLLNTPGAEIDIDGKHYTAPPVQVRVDATRTAPPADENNKDYFMRQSIQSGEHIFVGQQLPLTLQIFTHVNLADPELGDSTLADFENEPLGEQENSQRLVQGVPYAISTLRRALFPLKAGSFEIPARELKAKIRVQSSRGPQGFPFGAADPFDPDFMSNFFGQGRLKEITIRSNPLQLRVEPLPPPKQPLALLSLTNPPVGMTTIAVKYDPAPIKFGETKSAILTVTSEGSIQALKASTLQGDEKLKIYEESPETKTVLQGDSLITVKNIKLSLVPLQGNHVHIAPFELSYFDVASQTYSIARSSAIDFDVIGAPIVTPTSAPSTAVTLGNSNGGASSDSNGLSGVPQYQEESTIERWTKLISPSMALLIGGSIAGIIFASIVGFVLRRRSASQRTRIGEIKKATSVEQIVGILKQDLALKFPQLGAAFSRADLRAAIEDRDLLYRIESVLDRCDAALFSGRSADIEEIRSAALEILTT